MADRELKEKFRVPEELWDHTGYFMDDTDWEYIRRSDEQGLIDETVYTEPELLKAFQSGLIDKVKGETDSRYRVGTLYDRIECIVRSDYERWKALPAEVKTAVIDFMQNIDRWVAPYRVPGENQKIIYPYLLEEAIEFIEHTDRQIFLQDCDCRLYHEKSDHLVNVCLHFEKDFTNTNYDRGNGRLLTKEEAVGILIDSDRDGLIHNFEGDSFCNCCGDCCWAVRQIEKYRENYGDPHKEFIYARYLPEITEDCVKCGACIRLCSVEGSLVKDNDGVHVNPDRCVGCGVCRSACKRDAIRMRPREM